MCHLEETLKLLLKAGFRLNQKKCTFAANSFRFLGFKISPDGVETDPEKISAIVEMPAPKSVKEVRRFLGCTGFLRRHIKDYAKIAAPFTCLTHKDSKFQWREVENHAFEQLKQVLTSSPVLKVTLIAISVL